MKIINRFIKKIPYVKKRIDALKGPSPETVLHELFNDKVLLVDIGANTGQTIDSYKKKFKDIEIYAFEPTPSLYNALCEKYRLEKDIKIYNIALGDKEGKIDFWTSEHSPTNSVLKPNLLRYEEFNNDGNQLNEIFKSSLDSIKVNTSKFDTWNFQNIYGKDIDIFKTDTQGYDYNVLLGAQGSLPKIKTILVELQFLDFYKNSEGFFHTIEFLYENGFYLYNLFKNNKNQIFECDALFVNKNLFQIK